MIVVFVVFDDRQEAHDFVAECEEEDIPAGIVMDLEALTTQHVMQ